MIYIAVLCNPKITAEPLYNTPLFIGPYGLPYGIVRPFAYLGAYGTPFWGKGRSQGVSDSTIRKSDDGFL